MHSPTLLLSDPPAQSPIADSIAWMQGAALGSVATTVAAVSVATIGLLMLSGRMELRRGITVVLGCFILFGASAIAAALTGFAGAATMSAPASLSVQPPSQSVPTAPPPAAYDPYAGASVLDRR